MARAPRTGPFVVLVVLSLGLTGTLVMLVQRGVQASRVTTSLPDYGRLPDFSLTAHEGHPVTRASLVGQVWIADFIFTRCAGQCPMMSQQMARLQRAFQQLPDVQLVSLSVDPEHDTPTVLADYARQMGAKEGRWRFVTGDHAAITSLARNGFHLGIGEGASPEEPIAHSVKLALVDQRAHVRGYYDAMDAEAMARLEADVARVRQGEHP